MFDTRVILYAPALAPTSPASSLGRVDRVAIIHNRNPEAQQSIAPPPSPPPAYATINVHTQRRIRGLWRQRRRMAPSPDPHTNAHARRCLQHRPSGAAPIQPQPVARRDPQHGAARRASLPPQQPPLIHPEPRRAPAVGTRGPRDAYGSFVARRHVHHRRARERIQDGRGHGRRRGRLQQACRDGSGVSRGGLAGTVFYGGERGGR